MVWQAVDGKRVAGHHEAVLGSACAPSVALQVSAAGSGRL